MRGMVALAIGIAAAAVFELDYTSRSASAVPGRPAAVGISPSAGLAAPDAIASEPGPDPGAVRPIGIDGGAPSLDELLSEFLDAVERRDTEAMNRLRLTKDEYQRIIIPGTVPPGQ